jgi:hypothetical protein
LDEPADVDGGQALDRLTEPPPDLGHREITGGQARIGDDDAGEAVAMLGGEPQPDEATPVLADECHRPEVEDVEGNGSHPLHVARIGVVFASGGLVGAAEADEVGADHTVASLGKYGDHFAIQERPRRLAMQQEHRIGVGGAVLDPRHAEPPALVVIDVAIPWRIREFRKIAESLVRCSQRIHGGEPTAAASL